MFLRSDCCSPGLSKRVRSSRLAHLALRTDILVRQQNRETLESFGFPSDYEVSREDVLEVEHEAKTCVYASQSLRWDLPDSFLEVVPVDGNELCDVDHRVLRKSH